MKAHNDDVADFIAGGRIVAYHANFARIVGNANTALLLSQLWYWCNKDTSENRDGWFWKTSTEIQEETGLTRREQDTARKNLRELGILEEELKGLPPKLWYRIDKPRFFALCREYLEAPISLSSKKKVI